MISRMKALKSSKCSLVLLENTAILYLLCTFLMIDLDISTEDILYKCLRNGELMFHLSNYEELMILMS